MASLLKLLIDFPCQVFIDYELKGNAEPNQLFKIPLKKGTYVLELKSLDILLYDQDYTIESNEEEDLLRINIKEENKEKVKEKSFWDISSMDISIKEDEGGIFSEKGLYLINNVTGEEKKVTFYRDELTYDIEYSKSFDACGLFKVKVYRDGKGMSYTVLVNKSGHIQIGGYSDIASFSNKNATVAFRVHEGLFGEYLNTEYFLIDKWNNIISYCEGFDYVDEDGFVGNYCIVGKNSKGEFGYSCTSYGLIDCEGNIVLECKESDIVSLATYRNGRLVDAKYLVNSSKIIDSEGMVIYENDTDISYYCYDEKDDSGNIIFSSFKFIVKVKGKYGILDSNCIKELEYVYDSIDRFGDSSYLKYERDGVIGFLDSKLHIVPLDFEFVNSISDGLIKKVNKYGMVEVSVDSDTLVFKEVIPCKYDLYKKNNRSWSDKFTYFFMKKQKDNKYSCDAFFVEKNKSNKTIKKVKSFICQDIDDKYSDNESFVIKNNDKWGILDQLDCKYDEIEKPYVVDKFLIKENDKWGILYKTECKYDKIICAYGGHYAVIWSENNKKYIGYLDNTGLYKREVDKTEALIDLKILNRMYPVIITISEDGKTDLKKIDKSISRNIYVCKESEICNSPEELKKLYFALTCNDIHDVGDENGDVSEDKVGVEIRIEGRKDFHAYLMGLYSFKTLSFVKECDSIWRDEDTGWELKYNKSIQKEELYYKGKIIAINDYIRTVAGSADKSIIAEKTKQSKWAFYDINNIQLSCSIFEDFDWNDNYSILRFNDNSEDISLWEFFTKETTNFRYGFPFLKFRYHDGTGNSGIDRSPFKNIRTFIDVLPRTVIAEPTNSALIEKSTIDRVAFIVEDDNIGMLTMREFIVGGGDGVKNYMNDKTFKPEIINNKTYEDFILYLDLMLEQSDCIIGVNTNNGLETIRKDIKKVKSAPDFLYKSKKTSVVDLCDKIDMNMINAITDGCLIDRVQKIQECYKKQQ